MQTPHVLFPVKAGVSLALLLLPAAISAQDPDSDPIFDLTPFEVETTSGYTPSNTLVATGFSEATFKVPLNISTLTSEFLDDTAVTDIEEAVRYMGAVTPVENREKTEQAFIIRGFQSSWINRNGVRRYANPGTENVDRIEVIKGPAAVFFGQNAPGGILNYAVKRASFTEQVNLKLSLGNDQFFRTELSAQGPLIKEKLAYRVYGSYLDREGPKMYEFEKRKYVFGGVLIRPWRKVSLHLEAEKQLSEFLPNAGAPFGNGQWLKDVASVPQDVIDFFLNNPDERPPLDGPARPLDWEEDTEQILYLRWRNRHSYWRSDIETARGEAPGGYGPVYSVTPYGKKFNLNGPGSLSEMDLETYTADLSIELTENISLRAVYNDDYSDRSDVTIDYTGGPSEDSWTFNGEGIFNILTSGTGLGGRLVNETNYLQVDLLTQLDFLGGDHRILLGYSEFNDFLSRMARDENPDPIGTFPPSWNPAEDSPDYDIGLRFRGVPETYSVRSYEDNDRNARYVTYQSKWFADRLVLLAGLRKEEYTQRRLNTDFELSGGGEYEASTPMFGLNWEFKPGISFFASHSESYKPAYRREVSPKSIRLPIEEVLTPEELAAPGLNETGTGYDIGFKADINEKFSGTLTFFEVELDGRVSENTQKSVEDPRNNDDNPDNDVTWYFTTQINRSRGMELDFVYVPDEHWQIRGAYSWIWEAIVVDSPETAIIGKTVENVAEHKASLWALYKFKDSRLEGLSIGCGATYTGKFLARNEWRFHRYFGGDVVVYDLLFRYETALFGKDFVASLNIKNLSNETYIVYGPNGDVIGRDVRLTLEWKF